VRQFPEADWKIWRALSKEALERFCETTLRDVSKFAAADGSAHERYLKMYKLVERKDRELGEIFNDFRRSTAIMQIALGARRGVITRAELERFSEETQAVIAFLLQEIDA
jgi:hypothetical protein